MVEWQCWPTKLQGSSEHSGWNDYWVEFERWAKCFNLGFYQAAVACSERSEYINFAVIIRFKMGYVQIATEIPKSIGFTRFINCGRDNNLINAYRISKFNECKWINFSRFVSNLNLNSKKLKKSRATLDSLKNNTINYRTPRLKWSYNRFNSRDSLV